MMPPGSKHHFKASTCAISDVVERDKHGNRTVEKICRRLKNTILYAGAFCSLALIQQKSTGNWHAFGFLRLGCNDEYSQGEACCQDLTNERHFVTTSLNEKFAIGSILQCFAHDVLTRKLQTDICNRRGSYITVVSTILSSFFAPSLFFSLLIKQFMYTT